MHEMALAQNMLEIVEQTAHDERAERVSVVRIEIGALSHVEPDALRFCFDVVTRGSVAEGARLDIDATPGSAWCLPCATTVAIDQRGKPCPRCGSYQLAVTGGDAMRVREIEIAPPDAHMRDALQGEA